MVTLILGKNIPKNIHWKEYNLIVESCQEFLLWVWNYFYNNEELKDKIREISSKYFNEINNNEELTYYMNEMEDMYKLIQSYRNYDYFRNELNKKCNGIKYKNDLNKFILELSYYTDNVPYISLEEINI